MPDRRTTRNMSKMPYIRAQIQEQAVKRTHDALDTQQKTLQNDVKQLPHDANAGVQATTGQYLSLQDVDVTKQSSDAGWPNEWSQPRRNPTSR